MGVLESFAIDHNSGLPVWIQIKNRIAYLIGSGAFVPGDRLPTVRALAVDLDISYNTVNRAYMDLEREGYISTRKGRGTFVAERHDLGAHTASDSPIELVIDDMIRVCSNAGLADDDIVAMVQARLAPGFHAIGPICLQGPGRGTARQRAQETCLGKEGQVKSLLSQDIVIM